MVAPWYQGKTPSDYAFEGHFGRVCTANAAPLRRGDPKIFAEEVSRRILKPAFVPQLYSLAQLSSNTIGQRCLDQSETSRASSLFNLVSLSFTCISYLPSLLIEIMTSSNPVPESLSAAGLSNAAALNKINDTLVGMWDLHETDAGAPEESCFLRYTANGGESVIGRDDRRLVQKRDFMPGGKYRCE
jgi:hypothetical protein